MSDSKPWIATEAGPADKKHAPATMRNRQPIIDELRGILPETGKVLEIASGSGEHIIAFAKAFPHLDWQPSDPDPECRRSIAAWAGESNLANVGEPLDIDASNTQWFLDHADAVLCINMIHIAPWAATVGLMKGASRILAKGAPLFLYSPFVQKGVETAESNVEFDMSLRNRNEEWGLRNLADVKAIAAESGFSLSQIVEMPANNLSVVFVRQ